MQIDPSQFLQYGAMGLLALVLVGGGIGLAYSIRWLAHSFLTPIKDAHLEYLNTTAAALSELPAIKSTVERIDTKTIEIHQRCAALTCENFVRKP